MSASHEPAAAADRRKRIRRTTLMVALIAFAFYAGFIIMMLFRASR
jgi:hypothetical protein